MVVDLSGVLGLAPAMKQLGSRLSPGHLTKYLSGVLGLAPAMHRKTEKRVGSWLSPGHN